MPFSHILITRPLEEARELAQLLASSKAETIIMPAFDFHVSSLFPDQISQLQRAASAQHPALLVFTSPRAVEYGLGQMPAELLSRAQIAAIGPSTARLLEKSGIDVMVLPQRGYSSEDLLALLAAQAEPGGSHAARPAFILAAPGGRTALNEGLQAQGYEPRMLMVYGRRSAELDPSAIAAIEEAESLLAIWTSANTMNALSQRLPPDCWSRLCRAEWLVISERLRRLARAFGPNHVHLAPGPTNANIIEAIKTLESRDSRQ
jgi:uroporphyrinogen-III synthase